MFLLTAFVFSHICSVFANFRHRFIVSFIYSIAEIKVKAIKYKKTDERLGLTNRKKKHSISTFINEISKFICHNSNICTKILVSNIFTE